MSAVFTGTTGTATDLISTPYTGGPTQIITVMAWVFLPTLTPVAYRDIVTLDPNIYMQIYTDGTSIDFGTANDDHVGQALAANTWWHVCQVVIPTSTTSRQIMGYVNGALNVNVTDGDTSVAYTNICIGNSLFSTEAFPLNGIVQDVRVWQRQLSQREILDEMKSQIPIHNAGILLWLPLRKGLYPDESGNNNVITVGSAVTLGPGFVLPYPRSGAIRSLR